MMTAIEYVDKSVNVVPGCSKVSAGCKHCFAEKMAKRLKAMGRSEYQNLIGKDGRWTGEVNFIEERLVLPNWRDPKRIFLNTMGDTFNPKLEQEQIFKILDMVVTNARHTFVVVTKQAKRAEKIINLYCFLYMAGKPIPNLWLLVSVEDQKSFDERVLHLLNTDVVVQGLSMEPLLGPVNIERYVYSAEGKGWVIVGGESGFRARPMHPDWARNIRDRSVNRRIPFFFKQWGRFLPLCQVQDRHDDDFFMEMIGSIPYGRQWAKDGFPDAFDIGKKKAGRVLDGRTWDEMPDVKGGE